MKQSVQTTTFHQAFIAISNHCTRKNEECSHELIQFTQRTVPIVTLEQHNKNSHLRQRAKDDPVDASALYCIKYEIYLRLLAKFAKNDSILLNDLNTLWSLGRRIPKVKNTAIFRFDETWKLHRSWYHKATWFFPKFLTVSDWSYRPKKFRKLTLG